jgi:hypothetical protein
MGLETELDNTNRVILIRYVIRVYLESIFEEVIGVGDIGFFIFGDERFYQEGVKQGGEF